MIVAKHWRDGLAKVGLVGSFIEVTETSLIDYSFPQREKQIRCGLKNSRVSSSFLSDEEFLLNTTANPVFDKRGPITILRTEVSLAGFEPAVSGGDDGRRRQVLEGRISFSPSGNYSCVPAWRKQ